MFRIKSTLTEECEEFESFLDKIQSNLLSLKLNGSQMSEVIKLCVELLHGYNESTNRLMEKNPNNIKRNCNEFNDFVKSKFESINSAKRR